MYTCNGTAGTPLYWTGAGNVTIGKDMDATGRNVPVLDNLNIQKYANALLPLNLLSFTAETKTKYAAVSWNTIEEITIVSYVVERSSNGIGFTARWSVAAANGYNNTKRYLFTDCLPFSPVSHYRLKMVKDDGSFTYSDIKTVSFAIAATTAITAFPNPTADYAPIKTTNAAAGKYIYAVSAATGQVITSAAV